jgi:cytidine deaminase
LIKAAMAARGRAVAPYSKFRVGAALLTKSGKIIPGANVESASYGLTCCAERVALFQGLTSGENRFIAIAVVAAIDRGPTPCGACVSCWRNMRPMPRSGSPTHGDPARCANSL